MLRRYVRQKAASPSPSYLTMTDASGPYESQKLSGQSRLEGKRNMGFYIEEMPDGTRLPRQGKADALLSIPGARQIHPPPKVWEEDLVCVVENESFDGAGYIYNQHELEAFAYPDNRRRSWLHVPDAGGLTRYGRMTPKEERNFER